MRLYLSNSKEDWQSFKLSIVNFFFIFCFTKQSWPCDAVFRDVSLRNRTGFRLFLDVDQHDIQRVFICGCCYRSRNGLLLNDATCWYLHYQKREDWWLQWLSTEFKVNTKKAGATDQRNRHISLSDRRITK